MLSTEDRAKYLIIFKIWKTIHSIIPVMDIGYFYYPASLSPLGKKIFFWYRPCLTEDCMPLAAMTVDSHGVGILGIFRPVPDKEKGHLGTRSLYYTEKQELLCQLILLPTTLFFVVLLVSFEFWLQLKVPMTWIYQKHSTLQPRKMRNDC